MEVHFLSDEAEDRVLNLVQNPLQKIFIVDVEVHSSGGKPALYRAIDVKDVIGKP